MKHEMYKIRAMVRQFEDNAPWHFITIEKEDAEEIKRFYSGPRRGFGSIPVIVIIGSTKWKTSIFPDKNSTYLLPLKKEVRLKEDIKVGDKVEVLLEVRN